jgi:hypothetical protein
MIALMDEWQGETLKINPIKTAKQLWEQTTLPSSSVRSLAQEDSENGANQ